jgi:hypothetical protein
MKTNERIREGNREETKVSERNQILFFMKLKQLIKECKQPYKCLAMHYKSQ